MFSLKLNDALFKKKCTLGGKNLLKVLRIILSISVVTLGSYSLITRKFDLLPHSLVGILTLVLGLIELKRQ